MTSEEQAVIDAADRLDQRRAEAASHQRDIEAGKAWLENQRRGGNEIADAPDLDIARSAKAGAPGDEGTVTFAKKGPRDWGAHGIQAAHDAGIEAEIARQKAITESMSAFRARFYVAFLSPIDERRGWRQLEGRSQRTKAIAETIIASERNLAGYDPSAVDPVTYLAYERTVRREAGSMIALGLLAQATPPDPDKIWVADPDTFLLTPAGAAEAWMVYEAARRGA